MSGLDVGQRRRLMAVTATLALLLALVALKAARLQLVLGGDLKELAERQYVRDLRFSAPRGNIYDAAGRPLAVSVPVWSVAAVPRRIDDPAGLAKKLSPILGMTVEKLHGRLARDRAFVWLKRRVTPEVADQIRALDDPNLTLHKESKRFYPNKELAGQLLGLVDIDGSGQSGLERSFDEHLRGRTMSLPGLRDNHGQKVALTPGVDLDVLAGDDVFLSIDARLQHVAEAAVMRAVVENDAKSGFAIVVDPRTGAIRALANAPLFNPNAPSETPLVNRRNHAISDTFEPGSTFKTVTFASALENAVVTPSERIFCENGRYQVGRFTIRDAHPESWLTAREVFKHSSNIGTLKIALRLGEERFKKTIDAFAFGRRVDIGLVEEASGMVPLDRRWGDVRTSTISYGHGLSVTGLQLAQMTSTIANRGVRVPLTLIDRVQASTGEIVDGRGEIEGERVLSDEAAKRLIDVMLSVVEEGGTATVAAIPGVQVAGKTGTAEKVDPVTGRYSRDLHVSSFIGFAPAENPRVAAIVVLDEPRRAHFGGATAGPVWREIVVSALVDEGLLMADTADDGAPETSVGVGARREKTEKGATTKAEPLSPYVGLTARQALMRASTDGVLVRFEGTGTVRSVTADEDGLLLTLVEAGAR
jgi:cell division protein FtsI (penicillin-binding protein 3)